MISKTDEKAMKLKADMKASGLSQKRIAELAEESGGDVVAAVLKGYNAGFVRGYDIGRRQNDEVGE